MTSKISVHEGVANVESNMHGHRLVGSTCPTTLRLNIGFSKHSFKLLPKKKGSKKDLVLVERQYSDYTPTLVLFHIKRMEDGKIMVAENPKDIRETVGAKLNYQVHESWIELRVGKGDTLYTSNTEATTVDGEPVMTTDAGDILKYIAGYINLRELRAASKRAKKRLNLEQALRECEAERDEAKHYTELTKKIRDHQSREIVAFQKKVTELERQL